MCVCVCTSVSYGLDLEWPLKTQVLKGLVSNAAMSRGEGIRKIASWGLKLHQWINPFNGWLIYMDFWEVGSREEVGHWGSALEGFILSSAPSSHPVSQLPGCHELEQLSSTTFHLDVLPYLRPKAMELVYHGLKPWAEINFFSFKLFMFMFWSVMKS